MLSPLNWAGPIFDKELRVLSRRRHAYAVRAGYLLFLSVLVTMQWFTQVRPVAAAGLVAASRMADAAGQVVVSIVWFQFMAAQVLAVVSLAGCVCEDIRRGTLDVLVASGIGCTQIVLGKVLSRILPIVMLLATGLPLLALVRLWGGVPGDFVIAGFCVTLTAVLLTGSMSLFFSIRGAQPHKVILKVMTVLVVLWILGSLWRDFGAGSHLAFAKLLLLVDPFAMMLATGEILAGGDQVVVDWPIHCGSIVLISAVLLAVSVRLLNRGVSILPHRRVGLWPDRRIRPDLRRITCPIILWKDYGSSAGKRVLRQIGLAVLVGILVGTVQVVTQRSDVARPIWNVLGVGWWMVLCLHTAALAALGIAREREGRSWPVLLATPLTRLKIVRDKAAAVLLKTMFGWLVFLFYSVVNQVLVNWMMGPEALVPLLIMTVLNAPVYATFLAGTGLYVGLRSRTTTTAVVVTLAVVVAFHFVRQYALIPLVSILFPLQLGAWLWYHAVNLVVEALVGAVLLVLTVRSLRRCVF